MLSRQACMEKGLFPGVYLDQRLEEIPDEEEKMRTKTFVIRGNSQYTIPYGPALARSFAFRVSS
jgi:hypothetical protein